MQCTCGAGDPNRHSGRCVVNDALIDNPNLSVAQQDRIYDEAEAAVAEYDASRLLDSTTDLPYPLEKAAAQAPPLTEAEIAQALDVAARLAEDDD